MNSLSNINNYYLPNTLDGLDPFGSSISESTANITTIINNEVADIGDQITIIEGDLTTIENNVSIVNNNITEINNEITTIEENVTNNITYITGIQTNITEIINDIITIEENINDNMTYIIGIQGDITRIDNDITTIEGNITTIEGNVSDNMTYIIGIQGDITRIDNDITTIEGNINNTMTYITGIQGDITRIDNDITTIEGNINNTMTYITGIQGDITRIDNDITAIEGNITNINANIGGIQGDITAIEGDVTTLENTVATINTNITGIQSNITTINNNVSNIQGSISTINTNIGGIQADITTIEGSITTIQGDLTNYISDNDTEITNINTNITGIQGDITTIEGDITTIEGNISTINNNITGIQGDITTIEGNISTINNNITGIQGDLNKYVLKTGDNMTGALSILKSTDYQLNLQSNITLPLFPIETTGTKYTHSNKTVGYIDVTTTETSRDNSYMQLKVIQNNSILSVLRLDSNVNALRPLNMNTNNKIINLADGVSDKDAVNVSQLALKADKTYVDGKFVKIIGDTMTGSLIIDKDATNYTYKNVYDNFVNITSTISNVYVFNTTANITIRLPATSSGDYSMINRIVYIHHPNTQTLNIIGIPYGSFNAKQINRNGIAYTDDLFFGVQTNIIKITGLTTVGYYTVEFIMFGLPTVDNADYQLTLKSSQSSLNNTDLTGIRFIHGNNIDVGFLKLESTDFQSSNSVMSFQVRQNSNMTIPLSVADNVVSYVDLSMTSKKIKNMANGTDPTDAINKSQLDLKADISWVNTQLLNKADLVYVNNALGTKLNTTGGILTGRLQIEKNDSHQLELRSNQGFVQTTEQSGINFYHTSNKLVGSISMQTFDTGRNNGGLYFNAIVNNSVVPQTIIYAGYDYISFFKGLNMGTSNKILNLADGTDNKDAVNKSQLDYGLSLKANTTYIDTNLALKANKDYVDAQDNAKVNKSGDIMAGTLTIEQGIGTLASGSGGTITLDHLNSGGGNSIVFKSKVNAGSDYGYIEYRDNYNNAVGNTENSALIIGVENDGTYAQHVDTIYLKVAGVDRVAVNGNNMTIKVPIVRSIWSSGELIKTTIYNNALNGALTNAQISGNTYIEVKSIPFVLATNSTLWQSVFVINVDMSYYVSGSGEDRSWVRISDHTDGTYQEIQTKFVYWHNNYGGGNRSGVIFPVLCSYTPTNAITTRTRDIRVWVRHTSDVIYLGHTDNDGTSGRWTAEIKQIQI